MNNKLAVLAIFALSVGLIGNAYAHKEQVVGNYQIKVGWVKEPPMIGKPNSVEVFITKATASDKTKTGVGDHDSMDHDASDSVPKSSASKSVSKMSYDDHKITKSHDHKKKKTTSSGIAGLKLDADITVNGKKTMLKFVEDKKTKGRYYAVFTPMSEGFPTVHVVGKIKNTPVEVSFHPDKVEKSAKK